MEPGAKRLPFRAKVECTQEYGLPSLVSCDPCSCPQKALPQCQPLRLQRLTRPLGQKHVLPASSPRRDTEKSRSCLPLSQARRSRADACATSQATRPLPWKVAPELGATEDAAETRPKQGEGTVHLRRDHEPVPAPEVSASCFIHSAPTLMTSSIFSQE